jgi:hypothetical protein
MLTYADRVNEGWEPSVFRAMFADWLTPTGHVSSRILTYATGDSSKRNVERETTKLAVGAAHLAQNAGMLTHAHVCARMLTYVRETKRRLSLPQNAGMLTYARVCARMLTYAGVCLQERV